MLPPRYAQSRCVVLRNCWRQTHSPTIVNLIFMEENFPAECSGISPRL